MRRFRLFYSIEDRFPPFRVDLTELFFAQVATLAADITWYMRRGEPGPCGQQQVPGFPGQPVHLPWVPGLWAGKAGRALTRLAFWVTDIWQLARHAWGSAEVIQVRDKYLAGLFGLLLARAAGRRFVYWCSYPFPEHYDERARNQSGLARLYSQAMAAAGYRVLYRFVMPRADHCFVQSTRMRADIAAFGVPAARMTAVPMGVPDVLLTLAAHQSQPVVPGRVVYIGTLAAVRRMELLLDAFAPVAARFAHAELWMVGEGDLPEERQALEAHARRIGIGERVRFTGFLPMQRAWELAATAAVCVSPIAPNRALLAGSPTKLIEYMALGRPVVCNDHPEQQEVIAASGAGHCVGWSAEAFAEAIGWMLAHPQEAEALGRQGPAWVAANRTYSVLARQVVQTYERLLADPARPDR